MTTRTELLPFVAMAIGRRNLAIKLRYFDSTTREKVEGWWPSRFVQYPQNGFVCRAPRWLVEEKGALIHDPEQEASR